MQVPGCGFRPRVPSMGSEFGCRFQVRTLVPASESRTRVRSREVNASSAPGRILDVYAKRRVESGFRIRVPHSNSEFQFRLRVQKPGSEYKFGILNPGPKFGTWIWNPSSIATFGTWIQTTEPRPRLCNPNLEPHFGTHRVPGFDLLIRKWDPKSGSEDAFRTWNP